MDKTEVLRQYRELDRDCARLSWFQPEEKRAGEEIFLPTRENMEKVWNRWKELGRRAEELPEPDRVFSLMKHHFQDFLEELEYTLRDTQEHPERWYLNVHRTLENLSRKDRRPAEEQLGEMRKLFRDLGNAREAVLRLIREQRDAARQEALAGAFRRQVRTMEEYRGTLQEDFPGFSGEQLRQLEEEIRVFQKQLTDMAAELSCGARPEAADDTDDLSRSVKLEEEEYRAILKKKLGVSLDELLSWYQEEMDKTRNEVFALAAKLDIPEPAPTTMREVTDLLFKYEAPCKSPQEMLDRAQSYLQRTRALAHEYVRLPEDETCICVNVPRSCQDSYPWGGYEGGDFRFQPLRGQMFLNGSNYRNITDGWIKLNSLHEAYPGHHVQYIRAVVDDRPETVRIGAKRVPILEGTCLRTERAFGGVFAEDPFFPLFVAYRRHHASVRICADLMLFYYGNTLEEVIQLYQRELGFDRVTARGQVQAHQNSPGYFTCYYYGMKKICGWEEEYGFSKKEYTELLFSAGYITMERLEELVKLTPEERERFYHEFASLIPAEERRDGE